MSLPSRWLGLEAVAGAAFSLAVAKAVAATTRAEGTARVALVQEMTVGLAGSRAAVVVQAEAGQAAAGSDSSRMSSCSSGRRSLWCRSF